MQRFLDRRCRILFATMAVGMGTDIPDIEQVVFFGVDSLSSAYQKGGHGGRSPSIHATMIWLIEPWVFEPNAADSSSQKRQKKLVVDAE
ncbi:hypothetical protein BDQ17DRAFT_1249456 [Cyathus striatus]|nr:hypothetical protein BDQ17DRAFT_1249456 [Cyathus striatus]